MEWNCLEPFYKLGMFSVVKTDTCHRPYPGRLMLQWLLSIKKKHHFFQRFLIIDESMM